MSVLSPPEQREDELELLIREARARKRKRWLGAAAFMALLAGAALAVYSIASGGSSAGSKAGGGISAVTSEAKCGTRVAGPRILAADGRTVYREPSPVAMSSTVRCSGSAIWIVFVNGVGMMHEEYVGVRSGDGGRTWRVVF